MFAKAIAINKPAGTDTLIGQATRLEGHLECKNDLRIEGTVIGDITCIRDATVGEKGLVESHIRATNVIIAGTVNGDVEAAEKLIIEQTGKLTGNVKCNALIIKEGGQFNGMSRMSLETEDEQAAELQTDIAELE